MKKKARKPFEPKHAKDLDGSQVHRLASIGTPVKDIAYVLQTTEEILHDHFRQELDAGSAEKRVRLRQKQLELALSGNVTMLIWLGKQYLGQADKQLVTQEFDTFEVIIGTPENNANTESTSSTGAVLEKPEEA